MAFLMPPNSKAPPMRPLLAPLIALALASAAHAQVISNPGTVTTVGTITAGNCAKFSASTVIQDAGAACGGSGGSPGGSNTQIQYNNSGSFGGASGLTTDGTSLTVAGGSQTTAYTPLTTTETWNGSGVVFKANTVNVTDTASSVLSGLFEGEYGGTTYFRVGKGASGYMSLWLLGGGGTPSGSNAIIQTTSGSTYFQSANSGDGAYLGDRKSVV